MIGPYGIKIGALRPRSVPLEQKLGSGAKNMDSETMNVGTGAKIEASRVKMGNSGAKIGAL